MIRLGTVGFILAVVAIACTPEQKPPSLNPVSWEPGKSFHLQVSILDRSILADTSFEKPGRQYGVRLTILDSTSGFTLEWQELLADGAAEAFTIPSTRIVYKTDRYGRFARLLNYDELHAYADSMATIYLRGAGADSAMASAVKAATLDSATLSSNLLKQVHLIHWLYGATFASDSVGEKALWPDLVSNAATPAHCALRANNLCDADDGLLSVCAWESPTHMNATAGIRTYLGEALEHADSVGVAIVDNMGNALVTDSVNVCFSLTDGIPVHIEQYLKSVLSSGTFVRCTYIGWVAE